MRTAVVHEITPIRWGDGIVGLNVKGVSNSPDGSTPVDITLFLGPEGDGLVALAEVVGSLASLVVDSPDGIYGRTVVVEPTRRPGRSIDAYPIEDAEARAARVAAHATDDDVTFALTGVRPPAEFVDPPPPTALAVDAAERYDFDHPVFNVFPFTPTDESCKALSPDGFACTREPHDDGPHVARTLDDTVCDAWVDETDEERDARVLAERVESPVWNY